MKDIFYSSTVGFNLLFNFYCNTLFALHQGKSAIKKAFVDRRISTPQTLKNYFLFSDAMGPNPRLVQPISLSQSFILPQASSLRSYIVMRTERFKESVILNTSKALQILAVSVLTSLVFKLSSPDVNTLE